MFNRHSILQDALVDWVTGIVLDYILRVAFAQSGFAECPINHTICLRGRNSHG